MSATWFEKPSCIVPGMARHALLEASAGTGKTYVIERLVVEMLLEHELPIEQVLVVTFTRRAAAEMSARIRTCLEGLLSGKDAVPAGPNTWKVDERQRALLRRALADFDQAPISTIHQFCQRVLSEQEILTGRLQVSGDASPATALREAMNDHLRRVAGTGSQEDQVLAEWVRSGTGTVEGLKDFMGKVAGQLELLRPLVDDAQLAACSDALLSQLVGPTPLPAELKSCGVKYDSPAADRAILAIQRHAVRLGLLHPETLTRIAGAHVDPRAFQLAFLEAVPALFEEGEKAPTLLDRFLHAEELTEPARALLLAIRALYFTAPSAHAIAVQTLLPGVVERLERLCLQRGVLDFDRLLLQTERALRADPSQHLRRRLQARYRAVLVDEFQDTDPTQWNIFRLAFLGATSPTRFIAVGDPKQAIYSFRGGDLATYVSARDGDATTPGLAQLPALLRNWRSTKEMVEAYNRLLTLAPGGELFLGDPQRGGVPYAAVKPARDVGHLEVTGVTARPFGVFPITCGTVGAGQRALMVAVVNRARHLLQHGQLHLPGQPPRAVRAADLMVLVDLNWQAAEYTQALIAAGIPAEQYRAAGLMQSGEATEVLELLQALARPEHPGSRFKAFRTCFFDLALDELETAEALPPDDARVKQWQALIAAATARDWLDLFGRLRDSLSLRARRSFHADGERALLTLSAVLDAAHQLARSGCRDLDALVTELATLSEDRGDGEENDDDVYPASEGPTAVRVLTIHKAKGLEAPIVFLAHAPRGKGNDRDPIFVYHEGTQRRVWVGNTALLEETEAAIAAEEELEARRFQYVALTRAQHQLWLPLFWAPPEEPGAPPSLFDAGQRYRATQTRLALMLDEPHCEVVTDLGAPLEEGTPNPPPTNPPPQAPPPVPSPAEVHLGARGLGIESFSSLSLSLEDPPDQPLGARPREGELPRGAGPGRAVHALLEDAPLEATKPGQTFEAWLAHPKVRPVLERRGPLGRLEHTQRLVFHALHDRVTLPGGAVIDGLGTLRLHREVPFDLPWPSAGNPFGSPVKGRWTIDRGFLTGVIDFAFEHQGRVYFGDWKSNSYPSYDADTLMRSVLGSYGGQVLIYSLALCRLYGIATEQDYARRFGGALYVYLRGLLTPGQGLYAHRPRWSELARLDETLRQWGLPAELRPKLELVPDDEPVESDEDHDGEDAA